MENLDSIINNLTGKDEKKAQEAACYLVDSSDIELFKLLVNKSDYLFDFVRNNVANRIYKAINKKNFLNILKFFDVYSSYYDDLFANILAQHANQDLTDEIFDLLEKGTVAQKTYAAKYFSYIPDTVAIEMLYKYAFCEDEYLSYNAAEALGQMQDDVSYDMALGNLASNDDFDKLNAVKFFNAYGRNFPIKEIINAMFTSKMPENIAGQIPYMVSLLDLVKSDLKKESLFVIDYIVSGLGEILPLSDIFQFELKDVLLYLINLNKSETVLSPKIAQIILSSISKFNTFNENQEYVFDEDKNTKNEVNSIYNILNNLDAEYIDKQKMLVVKELDSEYINILSALPVIVEFNITKAVPRLQELVKSDDEIIISEVLSTLNKLNAINNIDLENIISKIKNPNIKALIENIKK